MAEEVAEIHVELDADTYGATQCGSPGETVPIAEADKANCLVCLEFLKLTDTNVADARRKLEQELAKVRKSNAAKYQALTAQDAVPSPVRVMVERLETLLEMLLDADSKLAFNLRFEQRMTDVLNECLAAIRQQRLTQAAAERVGKVSKSGLIVPG